MIQNYYESPTRRTFQGLPALILATLLILATGVKGWGQTPFSATYTFTGTTGHVESFGYNGTLYDGISMGTFDKVGVTSTSSTGNFRASDWPTGAITGSDVFTGSVEVGKYFGFTITAAEGYKFTVTSITFGVGRSATGTRQSQWMGSIDNYETILYDYTTLNAGLTNSAGVLTNPDLNTSWTGNVLSVGPAYEDITGTAGFRYYLYNTETTAGTAGFQGPITITGTYEILSSDAPMLTANPTELSNFTYVQGIGPSAIQSFIITGGNLEGNVELNQGENFEISTTGGETFAPAAQIILTPNPEGIVNAEVFLRLKAGLLEGNYSENVTISGGGATLVDVAMSGSVAAPPSITFYFSGPEWMNNDPHVPEIHGPFNDWASAATMTYDTELGWWKVKVEVPDASAEIEYQSRFSQNGATKYQKAFENFFGNPTFSTTTGEIWIDASNNGSYTWDEGNDFYLSLDKITEYKPIYEPSGHATAFTATTNSVSKITLSWTDSDADFYLIKGSTIGFNDISGQMNGTSAPDSELVVNVAAGTETHQFSQLLAGTEYFFKIFSYNGSSGFEVYKPYEGAPSASATTQPGGLETFENLETEGSSYQTGTFVGQDGSTWTYTQSRGDVGITGKAIMIGRSRTPQSNFYSGTIGNGIGILNFDYMQAFGTNVNLNVLVNDVVVANVKSNTEENVVKNSGDIVVNVPGDFVIKFINVNNSDGQVVVDNVSWTAYTSPLATFIGGGDWNEPTNWELFEVPGASHSVLVAGSAVIAGDVSLYNLTIDGGPGSSLTLQPTASLTLTGTLLNHAGINSFILKSDPSGTASLIHRTPMVMGKMERFFDQGDAWRLISSPVVNQPIGGMFGSEWTPLIYDFYAYQEATATWLNQKVATNYITSFSPGQGYLVSFEPSPQPKSFVDFLNSGDVAIPLTRINAGAYAGANLIGNPYPSAIDWNLADRSLFLDDFAYVYDRTSSEAGVTEGYRPVDGTVTGATIAANQGFFVLKEMATADNFTFTDALRTHGGVFTKNDAPQDVLAFKLTHGEYFDQTRVRVLDQADFNRDRSDAIKMFSFNTAVPQLYSLTGDQQQVAINSVPMVGDEVQFTLGLRAPAAGQYTLAVQQAQGAFAAMPLYVQDLLTGSVYNLKDSPEFSFQAPEGDDPGRFVVTFAQPTSLPEVDNDALNIYTAGKTLHLQFSREDTGRLLQVYDLSGRMVMSQPLGQDLNHSTTLNVQHGIYLVRVTGQSGTHVRKVVFK